MKIAKICLSLSLFIQTTAMSAPACQNFSGAWEGVCTFNDGTQGNPKPLNIEQSSCDQIQIDSNLFEVGVPKIVKQETSTNEDGTVTSVTETVSVNWKDTEQKEFWQVVRNITDHPELKIIRTSYFLYSLTGQNLNVLEINSNLNCVYSRK